MATEASTPIGTGKLVGAAVRRVEDRRTLMGKAQFVDDLRLPGTLSIAFVRSQYAHARITRIDTSAARALPGVHAVFTTGDLVGGAWVMRVEWEPASRSPRHETCEWPVLARGKVRFVGEAIAAVVADDRYVAEDAAELVDIDYEPLEPVTDMERALDADSPLVHEEWGDNVLVAVKAQFGDTARAFADADVVVAERFTTGRHTALPMEGRACLASYEPAAEQLTFWSSSQIPHVLRTHLAQILDFPEHRMRVIAPDVGGGFGLKAHVFPEEVMAAYASRALELPVKWIEDRRENLIASLHAKHQIVTAELALRNDGTIAGLRARCLSDIGAYTEHPWSSGLEAGVTASAMPGPYKIDAYSFEAVSIATNKATIGAYRGVGMPAAVFAMERLIDLAARRLGLDPAELRRRNMIRREDHPYTNVLGFQIESGSHQEALAKALDMIGYEQFRERQKTARAGGRMIGLGIASYIETTAPGTAGWLAMGLRMAGYETATVRMDRAGKVTVLVGTHSHGQSHETTFAQIAADQLGVTLADVRVVFGDTAAVPYGWGTGGSRSAVVGGGATMKGSAALREKILRIASRAGELPPGELDLANGHVVRRADGTMLAAIADIARQAYLPAGGDFQREEPGLETTAIYEPPLMTHSNSTHIATIEIDSATGQIKILRYVVVEDCGRIINPLVVDGQIQGGVAQGIGTALLEEIIYDENGQVLSGTLMDYLVPTATDVPRVEIAHIESPSPFTLGGFKGMGEGGAIAPPAAIANAVADAISPTAARVADIPLTPERVLSIIDKAQIISAR